LKNSAFIYYALSPLLVPLVANQISEQVNWNAMDFIIMGTFLIFSAYWIQKVIKKIKSKSKKVVFISLIMLIFLLLWIEMAVGIFNSPIAGS